MGSRLTPAPHYKRIIWKHCTEEQLDDVAACLCNLMHHIPIIVFDGGFGAGKTTLSKRIISHLIGISHSSSPSFTYYKQYICSDSDRMLAHLDFYKKNSPSAYIDMTFSEILDNNDFVIIEWPSIVQPQLRSIPHINVALDHDGEHTRNICAQIPQTMPGELHV